MKRSDFLKNMFGAAVVAAMPSLVVKQIDTLPDPEVKPKKGIVTPQNVETALFGDVFYLYDNKELIAYSHLFNFSLRREAIPIQDCFSQDCFSMDSDGWQPYMSGKAYIDVNNMIITNINTINLHKSYHFLVINDDYNWKLYGDVYINKLERVSVRCYNIELILTGAMTMEDLTKK